MSGARNLLQVILCLSCILCRVEGIKIFYGLEGGGRYKGDKTILFPGEEARFRLKFADISTEDLHREVAILLERELVPVQLLKLWNIMRPSEYWCNDLVLKFKVPDHTGPLTIRFLNGRKSIHLNTIVAKDHQFNYESRGVPAF